jgi:hypothetical protein
MQGSPVRKIRVMTELIMEKIKEALAIRREPELTVGQYNAIYESVQDILDGNV